MNNFVELNELHGGRIYMRHDEILYIGLYRTRDHKRVLHFLTEIQTKSGTRYVQETVGEVRQRILNCQQSRPKLEPKKLRPQKNTRRMTDAELRGEVF